MKIHQLSILMLSVLLFISCSNHEDTEPSGIKTKTLPVEIEIPAEQTTRAWGDPGSGYSYKLPRYLYLFLVSKYADANNDTTTTVQYITSELDSALWEKNEEENIYKYIGGIKVPIPELRTTGEVYCATSYSPLHLNTDDPLTQQDVLNTSFSFSKNDDTYAHLKDIYSTNADLKNGTQYYGTISDYESNNPYIKLKMYHVAAILDIDWNVAEDINESVSVKSITIEGLKQEGCLLFRPNKNTTAGSNTYQETFNTTPGTQWYGRTYYYIIPYAADGTNIQLPLRIENGISGGYKQTTINMTINQSSFVPWMYGNIIIKDATGWLND